MKRFLFIVAFLLTLSSQVSLWAQTRKEKVVQEELPVIPELSVNNNILYIKNAPVGAKLQILTIVGNKVREIEIRTPDENYELHLPKAIYIFKLEGIVRKFVIR